MKIRNELFAGLAVILILSSLATYLIVRISVNKNFDDLVEKNDIAIAKNYAESISAYCSENGTLDGIEQYLERIKSDPDTYNGTADRTFDRRHPKDSEIPIVITDKQGAVVFSGLEQRDGPPEDKLPQKMKTDQGEEILIDDDTIGYVFFKSMITQDYNPQELTFIKAVTASTGISVLLGIILAVVSGTLLAARFAKPITELDSAVKKITSGDLSARVDVAGRNEIGSLAENYNHMADRLQKTENSRQTLLSDIAHELRTPVSVIQANLEMIIDGVYTADEERMKSLYEETRILTGLISDLRSLSDLESGAAGMNMDRISLSGLLDGTCGKLRPLFEDKGIHLNLDSSSGDVFVTAEEEKLRQVLRNIIGNAHKYAPSDTTVSVSLSESRTERAGQSYVRVTVTDEGEGVPEGDTEKIFERFYRVDFSRNRESGGRGLGLAISKRIIEAFGGCVGAFNNSPKGLSVWFELPVQ